MRRLDPAWVARTHTRMRVRRIKARRDERIFVVAILDAYQQDGVAPSGNLVATIVFGQDRPATTLRAYLGPLLMGRPVWRNRMIYLLAWRRACRLAGVRPQRPGEHHALRRA